MLPIKAPGEKSHQYSQLGQEAGGDTQPPAASISQEEKPLRRLFITLAGLILVTIPAMIVLYVFSTHNSIPPSPLYQEFLFEPRIFHRTPFEESNKIWKCLPNGNGLVHLSLPTTPTSKQLQILPLGLPSEDGTRNLYGISWTHQLYCLGIIRSEFYSLSGNTTSEVERLLDRDARGGDEAFRAHVVEDCFDYLRQKIFCVADMTVEGAAEGLDDDGFGNRDRIDGFEGVEHQCRVKVSLFLNLMMMMMMIRTRGGM